MSEIKTTLIEYTMHVWKKKATNPVSRIKTLDKIATIVLPRLKDLNHKRVKPLKILVGARRVELPTPTMST